MDKPANGRPERLLLLGTWRLLSRHQERKKKGHWPIHIRYQSGDCRHVERAAPIPVPVQIRIPRLYRVEVLETPANWWKRWEGWNVGMGYFHYLQFPGPDGFRWVLYEPSCEVAYEVPVNITLTTMLAIYRTLNTCNHIMVLRVSALSETGWWNEEKGSIITLTI